MRTPTSRTDRAGFTLLELALVIIIIGIVSGLVFANLDVLIPGERLRRAASEIVAVSRFARTAARMHRVEVTIEYDLDKDLWAVTAVLPVEPEEEWEVEPLLLVEPGPEVLFFGGTGEDIRIRAVHYGENGIVQGGAVTASFKPGGAVGEHMVVLESESGSTIGVFVPALTGMAFLVDDGSTYEQIRAERRLR
ncbi:MAG: pilus assembly FimT family protein [Planctomycetota bacterium]|jgi:prepilin-type N-terminal cleavage/methylation domain-containing protein